MDFALGNVVKCETIKELLGCTDGISPDCLWLQDFVLTCLNLEGYANGDYVAKGGLRLRIRQLDQGIEELQGQRLSI